MASSAPERTRCADYKGSGHKRALSRAPPLTVLCRAGTILPGPRVGRGLTRESRPGRASSGYVAEGSVTKSLGPNGFAGTDEERQLVEGAIPTQALGAPKRPRKLLVMSLNVRDGAPTSRGHKSIGCANLAFELMGKRTCAYETVFNNDVSVFRPEDLAEYDSICFNNTVGVLTEDPMLRQSLLDFVANGKGLVGIRETVPGSTVTAMATLRGMPLRALDGSAFKSANATLATPPLRRAFVSDSMLRAPARCLDWATVRHPRR